MSPGRKPRRSPASTAGRETISRSTAPRSSDAAPCATARKVLPVPAGPEAEHQVVVAQGLQVVRLGGGLRGHLAAAGPSAGRRARPGRAGAADHAPERAWPMATRTSACRISRPWSARSRDGLHGLLCACRATWRRPTATPRRRGFPSARRTRSAIRAAWRLLAPATARRAASDSGDEFVGRGLKRFYFEHAGQAVLGGGLHLHRNDLAQHPIRRGHVDRLQVGSCPSVGQDGARLRAARPGCGPPGRG